MKKLLNILKIVLYNTFIFILCFYLLELIIYNCHSDKKTFVLPYQIKNPYIHFIYFDNYFTDKNNITEGRKPAGLEYNTLPIVIFGCSYAYGQYLNPNQIFSYKLSKMLKRPVYNRAIPAGWFSHMYYQAASDEFYKQVPDSDTVFYVFIDEHYRRMVKSSINITDKYLFLNYSYKNGKLKPDNYDNMLLNFMKNSYTIRLIVYNCVNHLVKSESFADYMTEKALIYFIETRKELENHWKHKVKFNVILYDSMYYTKLMSRKLKENGFNVIDTKELTTEKLNDKKYMMHNTWHPSEAAWDLLTPLIIEKSEL